MIEVIVAVPLVALLLFCVAHSLMVLISVEQYARDWHEANASAARVHSILLEPLYMSGYGMPKKPGSFLSAFRIGETPATLPLLGRFHTWPGAVSVMDIRGARPRENGRCLIVYGSPSGSLASEQVVISTDIAEIPLTRPPKRLDSTYGATAPISPKNWFVFGATLPHSSPMWVLSVPLGKSVIARRNIPPLASADVTIHRNDELFYVKATRAEAQSYGDDWCFFTEHLDGSGFQPRVMGVVDARFKLGRKARTLKLWLLTRGEKRYPYDITRGLPKDWPQEYGGDIPEEARRYRLFAFPMTFELRNF